MDSERLIKERDALRARVAELEALLTQALPHIQHASSAMYYGQSDGYRVREHAHDLLHVIDAAMGKSL